MRTSLKHVVLVLISLTSVPLAAQDHEHAASPYATDRSDIAALSLTELRQLRSGEGMGLARAAELNSFPGPKHLLDMADMFGLSEEQIAELETIRESMSTEALRLGEQIVEAERHLDDAFAGRTIDAASMSAAVMEIAQLRGALRVAHLNAHLQTVVLLTEAQIEMYDTMRGYR